MIEIQPPEDSASSQDNGLFKRYPKLGVILVAIVAYGILLAMCLVVAVLMIRG